MRKRRTSNRRRRRSIRSLFQRRGIGKFLRRSLFLLVFFAILVVGFYVILQSSLIQSVQGIEVATPARVNQQVGNTTLPRTTTQGVLTAPQTTPKSPSVAVPSSTAVRVRQDWKDYVNPTFGYALKYPPDMVSRDWKPTADILQSTSFYLEQDSNLPLYQVPEVTVSIFANSQSQSTAQWFEAHSKHVEGSAVLFAGITDQQRLTVGGLEALSFKENSNGFSSQRVLLARKNQVFSILVTDFRDRVLFDTFWAIVSTLRWSTPSP